jgi:hypothetical protein
MQCTAYVCTTKHTAVVPRVIQRPTTLSGQTMNQAMPCGTASHNRLRTAKAAVLQGKDRDTCIPITLSSTHEPFDRPLPLCCHQRLIMCCLSTTLPLLAIQAAISSDAETIHTHFKSPLPYKVPCKLQGCSNDQRAPPITTSTQTQYKHQDTVLHMPDKNARGCRPHAQSNKDACSSTAHPPHSTPHVKPLLSRLVQGPTYKQATVCNIGSSCCCCWPTNTHAHQHPRCNDTIST